MRSWKPFSLVALGLAACASGGPASRLEVRWAAGESVTTTLEDTVKGTLQVDVGGQSEVQDLAKHELQKVRDEVLEAKAGAPTKVRRETVEWWVEAQGKPRETRKLQGKTIVIKVGEAGQEVEGADGVPAAELRRNRLGVLPALLSFPKEPVRPGDSWPLDSERIEATFGGEDGFGGIRVDEASGTGRFLRYEDREGRRCAVLALDLKADGGLRALPDVDLAIRFVLTAHLDVERGRVLGIAGDLEGKFLGEIRRGDRVSKYSGGFTQAVKIDSRFR